MYKLFMTMLLQAMFKFVEKSDDPKIATRDAVRAHLKKLYGKKQTPDQFADFLRHVPYAYWVSRCRRVMPEPEIMLRDVLDVYTAFLNLDDPDTKSDRFPYGEPFYKSNHEDTLCLHFCRREGAQSQAARFGLSGRLFGVEATYGGMACHHAAVVPTGLDRRSEYRPHKHTASRPPVLRRLQPELVVDRSLLADPRGGAPSALVGGQGACTGRGAR